MVVMDVNATYCIYKVAEEQVVTHLSVFKSNI